VDGLRSDRVELLIPTEHWVSLRRDAAGASDFRCGRWALIEDAADHSPLTNYRKVLRMLKIPFVELSVEELLCYEELPLVGVVLHERIIYQDAVIDRIKYISKGLVTSLISVL